MSNRREEYNGYHIQERDGRYHVYIFGEYIVAIASSWENARRIIDIKDAYHEANGNRVWDNGEEPWRDLDIRYKRGET